MIHVLTFNKIIITFKFLLLFVYVFRQRGRETGREGEIY